MNFAQTIIEQSAAYPNKFAYRDGTTDLTYQELCIRIKQIAQGIRAAGVEKGHRVILVMEDTVDWPATFLACVYLGAVPTTMSINLPHDLFWNIADFIDARLVVIDQVVTKILKPELHDIKVITREHDIHGYYSLDGDIAAEDMHPDAPGYMGLSSGTTGVPKLAVQRHAMFYEGVKIGPKSYNMTHDSIIMSIPKMSWGFGLHNSITYTVGLGATAILIPKLPAPTVIFEYLDKFRPSIVASSPSIVKKLLTKNAQIPNSVECFVQGGEVLPDAVYDEFLEKFNIRLETIIGMLEVGNINYASTINSHERGTLGSVLDGVEVKVLNDQGAHCQIDEVGELYIKSNMNTFYYYNNYQKTQETFIGEWVRTGDCVYWNKNQRLVFVGRTDDVFKVNNLVVSPVEIELEIEKSQLVQQVAITGIANFKGVREVTAFVVPAEEFTMERFNDYVERNLFPHQRPIHVHLVDAVPETVTTKKDRKSLVKLLQR